MLFDSPSSNAPEWSIENEDADDSTEKYLSAVGKAKKRVTSYWNI